MCCHVSVCEREAAGGEGGGGGFEGGRGRDGEGGEVEEGIELIWCGGE